MIQFRFGLLGWLGFFALGLIMGGLVTQQWFFLQSTNLTLDQETLSKQVSQFLSSRDTKNLTLFDTIYRILSSQFYSGAMIDSGAMMDNALRWFVEAIGDPYTTYLSPAINEEFQQAIQGSETFEGIGAYISKREQGIQIDELIKNWPAFQAWLLPLDLIVKIDGELTAPLTINEGVAKIRWPAGTSVTLTILRTEASGQRLFDVEVVRNKVKVLSVTSSHLTHQDKTIGLIEIASFGAETEQIFRKELAYIQEKNIDWLILDLRWNGGWYLDIAVDLASHFLPRGTLVTYSESTLEGKTDYLTKRDPDVDASLPLVILLDQRSASASEILALALKQQRPNTTIVGTTSFGKWSIQTLQPLSNGWSLKYTVWLRFWPDGTAINNKGVTPDIEVSFDPDKFQKDRTDTQLLRALEVFET